jgi:SAM-dependent methyltransferase
MLAAIKRTVPYMRFKEWTKAVQRQAKLSSYRGTQYCCPICRTELRAFKPIWRSYWLYVQEYECVRSPFAMETFNFGALSCPSCDSYDRERLTALYLEQAFGRFDPHTRHRLVEFAPRHSLQTMIHRFSFIDYRSADLLNPDVQDRGVDLTDMSRYPDGSVDVFICSHVLEHIPEDRKAMRELNRILTADGFGILLVPLFPDVHETHEDPQIDTLALRWKYFGAGDHVRQYGKRDFVRRLEEAGFLVEQLGVDHFGAEVFRRAGVAENSVLYVVKKIAGRAAAEAVNRPGAEIAAAR